MRCDRLAGERDGGVGASSAFARFHTRLIGAFDCVFGDGNGKTGDYLVRSFPMTPQARVGAILTLGVDESGWNAAESAVCRLPWGQPRPRRFSGNPVRREFMHSSGRPVALATGQGAPTPRCRHERLLGRAAGGP